MAKKIRLAVIFGGPSGEHEISLRSAREIMDNLNKDKYEILPILISKKRKWRKNLLQRNKIDLAIIIGHGTFMEDGQLQAAMEKLRIPYLFSQARSSALAMDKRKAKIIAKGAGSKIAKGVMIKKGKVIDYQKIIRQIKWPLVIKPNTLGSSVGMSIVSNRRDFYDGLRKALKWDKEVLLEEFIAGRELTAAVIEPNKLIALPIVEIKPRISQWFDYQAKYKKGGSQEICPAKIPAAAAQKIQRAAKKIFRAIGCRDLARIDFIWRKKDNQIYFLEINTIPGMTKISLVPLALRKAGCKLENFLDVLIKKRLNKK